nr:hypothetical protein [Arenimonas daejeonensis]
MAVQTTVSTAPTAAATRLAVPSSPSAEPPDGTRHGRVSAQASSPIGTKVATASTPSRESQELRHWENARQARCGWPRCPSELSRPADTSNAASASCASRKTAPLP